MQANIATPLPSPTALTPTINCTLFRARLTSLGCGQNQANERPPCLTCTNPDRAAKGKAKRVRIELHKKYVPPKKTKHSAYCEYSHNCDKDYSCVNGDFCAAFKHTKLFSSLKKDTGDGQRSLAANKTFSRNTGREKASPAILVESGWVKASVKAEKKRTGRLPGFTRQGQVRKGWPAGKPRKAEA